MTLADIIVGAFLTVHFMMRFEEPFRASVPHLTAWFNGLATSEIFTKVYGEIKICK
jgi:tRNA synthetases class I (E and Q), catalytic domain